MKNLFFTCLVILVSVLGHAHAVIDNDSELGRAFHHIRAVEEDLSRDADPHKYDKEMGRLAQNVRAVFDHFFPEAELVAPGVARSTLLNFAEQNNGNLQKPNNADTWPNLLKKRFPGDLHPTLLPMALHCAPTEADRVALLMSADPVNESMSAVYNVWFVKIVRALKKADTEERGGFALAAEEAEQPGAAAFVPEAVEGGDWRRYVDENGVEQEYFVPTAGAAASSSSAMVAARGDGENGVAVHSQIRFLIGGVSTMCQGGNPIHSPGNQDHYQRSSESFYLPEGRNCAISGQVSLQPGTAIGVALKTNGQLAGEQILCNFGDSAQIHDFEIPVTGSGQKDAVLMFTNQNPGSVPHFMINTIRIDQK